MMKNIFKRLVVSNVGESMEELKLILLVKYKLILPLWKMFGNV